MEKLTPELRAVYEEIRRGIEETGIAPPLRTIARNLHIPHASVNRRISALAAAGVVKIVIGRFDVRRRGVILSQPTFNPIR